MIRRKIDKVLLDWKRREDHKPLIVSGARQIGKTTSIREFGKNYDSFIEINFVLEPKFKSIFDDGYTVNDVIKLISLLDPKCRFIPNNTLILFDGIQEYPDAVTSLKSFASDGRFDVICSGSLLGVNYNKIKSIPVGSKEEYEMHSLDFEEYLWARGYKESQIDDIYSYMKELKPLPDSYFSTLQKLYKEYIFVGGMPEVVQKFTDTNSYGEAFEIQKRICRDYEDDITKYVEGLDNARVKNFYRHIPSQLSKDNHKYQISKIGHGARFREYTGIEDWLKDAGIINVAYNISELNIPFDVYEINDNYRVYYQDHSLFIANLDEESKEDLIVNSNYEIYNGSLYESLVSEALAKSGYKIYYYKSKDSTVELDFVIRIKNEIIPIEVKKERGRSASLNTVIENSSNSIKYGVKLTNGNIGFSNNKFTFPYFLSFLLRRFFKETNYIEW